MKTKLPSIVVILVLTTLTSLLWISLSIYRAATLEPDVKVSEEILLPLEPSINSVVVTEIESRIFIDPSTVSNVIAISTPIPTPSPTIEPTDIPEQTSEATPSAEPIEEETP